LEQETVANFDLVVIGAFAGGMGSLQRVVEHLQPDFPAAILIALHLPDGIRSMLPQILERAGSLPTRHARDGDHIEPGRIDIAPAGFHLTVTRRRMAVTRGARELDEQAQQVRNLVLGGVGSAEEVSTAEEPTPEEP
jgi:two-component system, chemotaxis family, protein-glutamate methylesterase/glutaminase